MYTGIHAHAEDKAAAAAEAEAEASLRCSFPSSFVLRLWHLLLCVSRQAKKETQAAGTAAAQLPLAAKRNRCIFQLSSLQKKKPYKGNYLRRHEVGIPLLLLKLRY